MTKVYYPHTNCTIPPQEAGGMMTLADVYCRFNRARGMEVLAYSTPVHTHYKRIQYGLYLGAYMYMYMYALTRMVCAIMPDSTKLCYCGSVG